MLNETRQNLVILTPLSSYLTFHAPVRFQVSRGSSPRSVIHMRIRYSNSKELQISLHLPIPEQLANNR